MRFAFPVSLDVTGRRCVVAGGGPLARSKAADLAAAGADVVEVAVGSWSDDLLDGAFLVVVSREDATDAAAVYAAGRARGVLVNVLDDVDHCDFAFPAMVRRGDLRVAISTAGRAPAVAGRLRRHLDQHLSPAFGALVDAADAARADALPRTVPFPEWAARWRAALADLDGLLSRCERGEAERVQRELTDAVVSEAA